MNGEHTKPVESRTEDLVIRLRRQWEAWGSPTDRDKCLNETRMAMDCKEAADEIERLRALVPTSDYVLVEDMDESNDRRWGKGLFTCFGNIKSVS